ncbi:MAG: RsfS/YbeB/iojap family protein, partial [Ignavibacteria bacterium]|nr:RsfS/YbeB/iojap family protein [Ignavibacteria bacterium]
MAVKRKVSARKPKALSLQEIIIQSILDKKGEKIISLDMRKIDDAIVDSFIICEADNTMQVKAIAENVMSQTEIIFGETPWHHEGLQRLE